MEIMDFHAHIYPEKIADKAVKSVGEFYNIPMDFDGTSRNLIEQGKKAGVSRFLVHSVATVPRQVVSINDFIAQQCKNHKELTGFGTIHAEMDNPIEEIDRIERMGLKGLKIHPDTQLFNIDDPKMMEIYDYIQEKEIPIAIHCGDYRYTYSHPARLVKLLENFPRLVVVAAHFGGWSIWDLALEILEDKIKNSRWVLDTSSSLAFLGKRRFKELIDAYGTDKIVFGTDFPMWSAKKEIESICTLGYSEHELEKIFMGNAKRVLKENE